jgi:hypothetical protein
MVILSSGWDSCKEDALLAAIDYTKRLVAAKDN